MHFELHNCKSAKMCSFQEEEVSIQVILPESTYYLIMHFLADDWIHFHLIFLVGRWQKVSQCYQLQLVLYFLAYKCPFRKLSMCIYVLSSKVGNTFASILFTNTTPLKVRVEVALFTRNSNQSSDSESKGKKKDPFQEEEWRKNKRKKIGK